MVLTSSWRWLADDFEASPRPVVVSFTFLAKHVPNIISIVLFKFVVVHLLAEFALPEGKGLIHAEPEALRNRPS